MNLDERIKLMLAERHETKAELSRVAGVTKTAVGMWEKGITQTIEYETAKKIEAAWGFRAEWIRTGKKPIYAFDGVSPEMGKLIEQLVKFDREGGERRADVIYLIEKLLPLKEGNVEG